MLCALAGLGATSSALAETLEVLTPDLPRAHTHVSFTDERSVHVTLGPLTDRSGRTKVTIPLSPEDRTCRVRVCDTKTGRVAVATLDFGEAKDLTCTLTEPNFYVAHTLRLALVSREQTPLPTVRVAVTDAGEQHQEQVLGALDRFDVVEFSDLRPGVVTVEAAVGSLAPERTELRLAEEQRVHYVPIFVGGNTKDTDHVYRHRTLVLQTEDGQPRGQVFFGVSVLLFVVVLIVGIGAVSVIALLPESLGMPGRSRMRRAIIFAMLMCGLVLLGNGVALLAVGDAAYLAVVTAIAAVQLVAISWLALAVQARHASLTSGGTVIVVASLSASALFLPALAIEQTESALGAHLSIAQLFLVILAIAVVISARVRDRMAEDAARREKAMRRRRTECQVCGKRIHPVLGTCGCTVRAGTAEGLSIGRLAVKSAKGAMTQFTLGTTTTIGASAKCDIQLDQDPLVASNHCVIFERGKEVCIRDAPESSGTYVNGERISERTLEDGDEIRIGDSWLLFEK